ncbi:hypothetical protein DW721_05825 [Clostridium sp. AM27-31LB]|uniref:hypothetical protein n=1 Tax=Clostridium sp. AM27-31LB TaxID=2293026 RepID=UPI000E48621F|nr:hypothetical protein [Clostridium sp. AM27-31LB]RHT93967.1 hypothetical protein DW721_05825 [Clostridium sp. AM27-31LB]
MNIQKPDELNLGNSRIEIYDKDNNLLKVIEPYAVESCMNPGIFKITPIKIKKTKDSIIFISENIKTEIKKQDIESGDIEVKASAFIPQRRKAKNNCTKCTNCGRCSW